MPEPAAPVATASAPAFEIWCRVIDNYGDAGVCWRLARQLAAEHGLAVRLRIDQPQALASIAPGAQAGGTTSGVRIDHGPHDNDPGETAIAPTVHLSAFGCELPGTVRRRVADGTEPLLWVNLEYLSAEKWVDGCHGLASARPADGAVEHFFYPGFTERTGGLVRESALRTSAETFRATGQPRQWLAARGLAPAPEERLLSMFCYPDAPLADLLRHLAEAGTPTRVLAAQGVASEALEAFFGAPLHTGARRVGAVTVERFPMMSQDDYDRLLWSCDLNFVRGEDSWVRAQWAGIPFVWQPYPQAQQAHLAKLEAFIGRVCETATANERMAADAWADLMRAWSATQALGPAWERCQCADGALISLHQRWSDALSAQPDLASTLLHFCQTRLAGEEK